MLINGINEEKAGRDIVAITLKRRQRVRLDQEMAALGAQESYMYRSPKVEM